MERKRAFFSKRRDEEEEWKREKKSFFLILIYLRLSRRILLHSPQVASSVLVATDFRLPPPSSSSIIAIAVASHNGDRTCCVSPFVACESRERFLCSNGTQDRRGYYVQLLLLRRAITPGRCPGGGERRRESLKTFASRPRDCEWKLTSVSLFLSLSLLYALNGANLVREEERKREKETRRKGEKPRERGQRKRMKKKKKFRRFLFFFSYISLFNLGVP